MSDRNKGKQARWIPVFMAAFAATALAADADAPVKRTAMEKAVGGITRAERIAQQDALRAQLEAVMPEDALDAPLSIELSDQDHADLDEPYVTGTPLRIGVVKSITPNIEFRRGRELKESVIEEAPNGELTWAVSFESPGAQAVRLHLENFSLPPRAEMYFFSPDGGAYGPFTGKGRNGNGDFWTRSIGSDLVVIQLHYTEADSRNMTFTISELAHISGRRVPQANKHHDTWPCADNVACLVDATCADRGPAEAAKDAIAKMEWIIGPSVYTCTGGLLVDTVPGTQIPYFLTANHCTDVSIANLETWFNYTTESCNGMCPHNILTGGAPPSDTLGFTVLETSPTSDFCFGTLDEDPPAGAYFLGWNTSPVAFTNGADLYRISNANFGPQVYSQQDVDTSSPVCGGLPRGNIIYSQNNVGSTMGGSSGSPVVNNAGEVVGQLYGCCGYNCANDCDFVNNWTIDGAFAVTWPSVEQYLDPDVGCTSDKECNDEVFCNGAEWCNLGNNTCQSGTPPNCNDGVGCTDDSCNIGTDQCDNIPNDANCDDGLYCTGDEWCHATADCQSGTAPNCNDGVACTDDSCNEGTNQCDNIPNDGYCDDDEYCNGAETCHAMLNCQAGSDPCVGFFGCDEVNDLCVECFNDGDCDDDLYCNGIETCDVLGVCQGGSAVDCSDGVGCTDDTCNEGTDSCDHTPNHGYCADGLYCNGVEVCDSGLDCQSGTAVDCTDTVGCTDDSCNEGTDSCDNIPNDAYCVDALYCNGAETCHATLDCQAGTAVDCNDGVGCTDDSCNESTDSCENIANDAYCPDDGLFCNGTEYCHATADCSSTGDPCTPLACNETTDTCESVECTVPADCDDGSDCTVDDCIDGVCYNDCAGSVSSFPYSEDFEAGLGAWSNVGGDVFDWTRDSGGTPSSNTGPSVDHTTGTSSGFYMYIETSSPRVQGDTAILEGPCMDLTTSSNADLTFWYHMYGANIGTLDVEVTDDCTTWTNVWTLSGEQGNVWLEASVNLDAYTGSVIKVRFVGTRGASWNGDIAIDDIAVDAVGVPCSSDPECDDSDACTIDACVGSLCQNTPIDCDDGNDCTVDTCSGGICDNAYPSLVSTFPYNEGYEGGWGDWSNVGGDDMNWTRNSGSTPSSSTGPSGAHGGTWYVYTEASSPNYPDKTGIIEGPAFDFTGASDAEMTFWYHMYGTAMGALYVEASEDCVSWTTVWSLFGNQGNAWYQATVDLSAYDGTVITIRFRGVTGSSYTSDICVDDIEVTASAGPVCTVPADCDDGVYCNGVEDCVGGNCVDGTAVDCSDGVGCTDDSCNEGTDSCDNVTNDGNCADGLYCNGDEWCDVDFDCQAGTAVDCDDLVDCTVDSCNEGTDSCDNTPDNGFCDDGAYCNGAETCNVVSDCQPGSAVDCDDGVGCTDDSCNEGTDSCDNIANDGYCPDDGLYCNGTEFCDAAADCSSTGDPCSGGEVCNEGTDTCDPVGGARMETGTVSVGSGGVTVKLTNSYASPVVVCSVNYNNNTIPVVTRVGAVTSTSFDVRLQQAGAGTVAAETVHYIVVEEGTWTIDGVNIEAQLYNSTVTDENNSWVGEAQTYGQSYTTPVVLGQVMSENDADWSVFWDRGTSRTTPPSASSLWTGKTVCEDSITARADETIGFIVIEAGSGTIGGVAYESALGADTVLGVTNAPPYTYTFGSAFGSMPQVGIVTMAAVDGGNGGWAVLYGAAPLSATGMDLAIDEDTIQDTERNHISEQVGYVVFESAFVYP